MGKITIPEHILNAINSNKTSLGEHPSFPPKPTQKEYIVNLVGAKYTKLKEYIDGKDINEVIKELNDIVLRCIKEERKSTDALTKLCSDLVKNLFKIPEDTIDIEYHLVDTIDTSKERLVPEEDEDYSYEDIHDIQYLGDEVYKRRLLNALIEGASESYAYNVGNYIKEIYKINPELPGLYEKIIRYSDYLMYALDETSLRTSKGTDGTVEVRLNAEPKVISIKAYGTLFPILLQNAIKGILEVAILQGLPDNKDKAYYVMKKSDFKLAEIWDSRLGSVLWEKILSAYNEEDGIYDNVGLNFLFMEMSLMTTPVFNEFMQEVFANTNKGHEAIKTICDAIVNRKEEDDFNNYIDQNNRLYPIQDGYFSEDEFSSEMPQSY
jgi:hypothetical protein